MKGYTELMMRQDTLIFNSEVFNEGEVFLFDVPLMPNIVIRTVFPTRTKNNAMPSIAEKTAAKSDTPFSSNPAASISPSQT
jgi:hypothetical protein